MWWKASGLAMFGEEKSMTTVLPAPESPESAAAPRALGTMALAKASVAMNAFR